MHRVGRTVGRIYTLEGQQVSTHMLVGASTHPHDALTVSLIAPRSLADAHTYGLFSRAEPHYMGRVGRVRTTA